MNREQIVKLLRMILIAFAIACVINLLRVIVFNDIPDFRQNNRNERTQNQVNYEQVQENISNPGNEPEINSGIDSNEVVYIPVSPEKALSGLTKEEILNIRREEMRTSPIFSGMNYTPSSDVYRIDDGMPWISSYGQQHWSTATEKEKTEGISRDSMGITNPELLYFVQVSNYNKKGDDGWIYFYKTFNYLPYKIVYVAKTNTIEAYIKNEINEDGNYLPITVADSNAHDLGYGYAYMDQSQDVGFYSEENYSNNTLDKGVKEITGYYMHGSACGIPGGCNNYAPYWQYYNHFYLKKIPASFNIKLWKKRPSSPEDKADINFKMIFE